MKHVKWILTALLVCSLTSFTEKSKTDEGLDVGDKAPDFRLGTEEDARMGLSDLKGQYIVLTFWASYDATSRMQNAAMSHMLRERYPEVKMVSVSFDRYASIFQEAVRNDGITASACFADMQGKQSGLFKKYNLQQGFACYLLDKEGVIVAKDISADELPLYLTEKDVEQAERV